MKLGATHLGGARAEFLVWAPHARHVEVRVGELLTPLQRRQRGYHHGVVEGVGPGDLYLYRLDGEKERPDPASRYQPQGVHGPSQVVDAAFPWTDAGWEGVRQQDLVFYEIHVGTYTQEGTFDAVIPHLEELRHLGITAIELMPVAAFPGERNWGYDGVYPYAVQQSYGGPTGLKRLVNACHAHGMAAFLDVVYNHLGPEGNYLGDFGPYFSERYHTPWGQSLNFDGPDSDEVRRFFIENACRWVEEFHFDGLRLDAVHAILDMSAVPFLEELGQAVDRLRRGALLIAESDLNDPRIIRPRRLGGYGLPAQWSDDFHHALHALLTDERHRYYRDFGRVGDLARALRCGYTLTGRRSAYRRRHHGALPRDCRAEQFVVCAQNHDQVGNRRLGDRLAARLGLGALQLAAGVACLSPFLPLLFMGEEYGEAAPFLFFTDFGDPELAAAVRRGRRAEVGGATPDPQAEETFRHSKLRREELPGLRNFYRELLRLRRELPALAEPSFERLEVWCDETRRLLTVRRWHGTDEAVCLYSFREVAQEVALPVPAGEWRKALDAAGETSPLPARLRSSGTVELRLPPMAVALFQGR